MREADGFHAWLFLVLLFDGRRTAPASNFVTSVFIASIEPVLLSRAVCQHAVCLPSVAVGWVMPVRSGADGSHRLTR